ncbi:MAG: C40 family peptidase [Bacillota bacterium]
MSDKKLVATCAALLLLLTGAVAMAAQSVTATEPETGISERKKSELVTKVAVTENIKPDIVINDRVDKETKADSGEKASKVTPIRKVPQKSNKTKLPTTKISQKKKPPATRNKTVASRKSAGFDANKVIRFAMTLKGAPYRSGGTAPKGFDCSGFTMYVFKNSVGINLPHSSGAQAGVGQALKKDELVPGALVYFNTSGRGVSHVGIYIGDGKFIDSSNGKGVAVNSLGDKYWGSRYMGARLVN